MPVVSLPHGGGPWPFVDLGLRPAEVRELSDYLRALPSLPAEKPKALLVVSAHWEAEVPTVMTGALTVGGQTFENVTFSWYGGD